MKRLTWHEYFMGMAIAASMRSTCPRAQVGAVIVKWGKYPVSTGFNGSASGQPHCTDIGCDMQKGHCRRAVHAEANAIRIAKDVLGIPSLAGMSIYCTHAPCIGCANAILNSGIDKVFYLNAYGSTDGLDYLSNYKIQVEGIYE